ncbi:hypothetical protein DXG03_006917 [Asterophora parasitica]|uniref:Uncharacterized protein n=1 Tax=Asterophora parasitica TaxID=117018 RepID=A0A9P7KC02_9AGAR|nr:hypothetical protein DXG03_006917 [Asterophora parasitica]
MSNQLSETYIQDSFHSYLKSSLTQAKVERLLDADVLSSAEGDLMITGELQSHSKAHLIASLNEYAGPALCLYFAALRCTTNPPSVPLPRSSRSNPPIELSYDNCPPAFVSFLRVWSSTVPVIQGFPPEHQHDLARVICGLEPLSQHSPRAIGGIAADLRAVAIEISQRRSFQDRFASDLQAALDSGTTPGSPSKKASFVPPPSYDASPSSSRISLDSRPPASPQYANNTLPPQSPSALSAASPSTSGFPQRSHTPTVLAPHSPAIEFIRETLYASLGDALERQPSLRALLRRDPPRAYFASVAFAVLDVATTAVTPDGSVVGVLGTPLSLEECPLELRPFMMELAAIGRAAKDIEEEDNEAAVRAVERGEDVPLSRLERVSRMLEGGVGYAEGRVEEEEGRRSVSGRAVAFANRVNALSLGMTRLRAFRERQEDVFKVLAGIGAD